jgi:O-methyltransferase
MPHRDKCIVRQGYFPETAVDTEEQFAFVSIDVDLYQPIYEGLKFFYPRLVKGGYLFVHDYNHQKFQGAAAAVRRFSDEFAATYLPIPDTAGSAVFIK